jgi:3',5'-cyclic-AMP phosphodiesterase
MPDFSFIQITDHHLMESEGQSRDGFTPDRALRSVFRRIAAEAAERADFIVSTGDLVEPGTDATYSFARKLLGINSDGAAPGPLKINIEGLSDFPMYFLPGNHDDRPLLFKHFFAKTQPSALFNFSFDHKGVRFACIDWGEEPKAVWTPETRDFLSAAVQPGQPTVILSHHHVTPIGSRWLDSFIAYKIEEFWEILRGKNVLGIICGHVHIPYELESHGIPILGLRSTAFPFARADEYAITNEPPQFRVIHVREDQLTSEIHEVSD